MALGWFFWQPITQLHGSTENICTQSLPPAAYPLGSRANTHIKLEGPWLSVGARVCAWAIWDDCHCVERPLREKAPAPEVSVSSEGRLGFRFRGIGTMRQTGPLFCGLSSCWAAYGGEQTWPLRGSWGDLGHWVWGGNGQAATSVWKDLIHLKCLVAHPSKFAFEKHCHFYRAVSQVSASVASNFKIIPAWRRIWIYFNDKQKKWKWNSLANGPSDASQSSQGRLMYPFFHCWVAGVYKAGCSSSPRPSPFWVTHGGPLGPLFIFWAHGPVSTVQLSSGSNKVCFCGSLK